ncbi:MAG: hypothetical protein V3V89_03560, partial [Gammaproteobacteria bacterium]
EIQDTPTYTTPEYCPLPVTTKQGGKKISKQEHAPAITDQQPVPILYDALQFLGQKPDPDLVQGTVDNIIEWGAKNWNLANIPIKKEIQVTTYDI